MQSNARQQCFLLSNKIAKEDRPFIETGFIKDFMADAVNVSRRKVNKPISLSQRAFLRRIDAVSMIVHKQLLITNGCFQWYSMFLIESSDIQECCSVIHIHQRN